MLDVKISKDFGNFNSSPFYMLELRRFPSNSHRDSN